LVNLSNVIEVRRLEPLPETVTELCGVAASLGSGEGTLVLGVDASEGTVKRLSREGLLAATRIVHFATHGLLVGEVEGLAEPALVLTPPAGDFGDSVSSDDDGLLTASEVAQLKLDADWIVLSACNTASANALGAEALSGLARAFFYAGARALLVSHWAVNSQAAVKLMVGTFAAMARDPRIGRAEALRRAMLDLIENGASHQTHPAYWAPFVVVGEGSAPQ
jgi:CHAT domain-containing protein